ncbi:MAG: D-alanine--D-alanine ligase [Patescibacteria group bacterium]|nr:D-alanine--D-alanine ligase [Patescibacteria group bacterium]
MAKLSVAVLFGGPSLEHEVSVLSGRHVLSFLSTDKYDAFPVHIRRDGEWPLSGEELAKKADAVFIALHGKYGEDGTVQDILEHLGVPYTGSGVLASALGMNKIFSYRLFKALGLNVPRFEIVSRYDAEWRGGYPLNIPLALPLIVKPANQGSSMGVSLVRRGEELWPAVTKALQLDKEAIVQEYVSGTEITCGVLEVGERVAALEPIEIIKSSGDVFDYQAKYTSGMAEERAAVLAGSVIERIKKDTVTAHKAIGAYGFSRSDFIFSPDGRLYVLETNTLPGLTENSLFPKAALASGISFPDLLDIMIDQALRRNEGGE